MKLGDRALDGLLDWVTGPEPGAVLADRYELGPRIGEGGMGVVYAAVDRVSGKTVAVKIVRGAGDHDTARFEREVASLERVSHPAIVKCLAHGVHEGSRYLVMDRLEGCSLAERLRLGRLSVRDTLVLGARVAGALDAVHRAGIAHRDIKPSNIFLAGRDADARGSADGACLLDFGIARSHEASALTAPGALVGTPGYIAPERVRGDEPGERDPASDVFSLGCVLFECLLGRPPFTAETTYALLARVLLELAPLVREERPEAPLGLEALVEQMLAKEARERPDAAEVARACAELLASVPPGAEAERIEIAPGLAEGDVVGEKYRVERKLGEGGMGVVVAARHIALGTRVAIKLLRSGDMEEGRFLREAQATSQIESDHVARVLDVGRTQVAEGSRPYIVMEHLRGVDLARRLADRGPLPVRVAVDYVLQACAAIREAHALGIVHRDLKPSNVFIVERRDATELVKVLDFGISKLTRPLEGAGASLALTATADSTVMGSISYMSPEQLESSARADARSDIWSLGVVLFEILAGTRPFEGESAVAVAARIAGSPPRPLRELRADVPAKLEAVVAKCLAKAPSERYGDVDELVSALAPFTAADGEEVAAAVAAPEERERPRGRSMLLVAVAIGAVALVGAVAFVGSRADEHPEKTPLAPVASAQASAAPSSAAAPAIASAEPAVSSIAPVQSAAPIARPPIVARPPSPASPVVSAVRSASPPPSASSLAPRREIDLTDPALQAR